MLFDARTVFLVAGILNMLIPLVVWVTLRRQGASVRLWVLGGLLSGTSSALIGFQDSIPEWLTYDTAAILLFAGLLSNVQSLRLENGRPTAGWAMALLVGLLGLGYEVFRLIEPYGKLPFIFSRLSVAGLLIWLSLLAFRLARQQQLQSARWLSFAYWPMVTIIVLRAIDVSIGEVPKGLPESSYVPLILALSGIFSSVLGNSSFMGLYAERASRDQLQAATERTRREESARLGRQIAQLDRQRGMGLISTSLAHELSQPLTSIQMLAELGALEARHNKEACGRLLEYFEDIQRNTDNAAGIIQRLRLYIKGQENESIRLSLQSVIHNVTRLMGEWLKTERIDIRVHADEAPVWVMGDAVQLAQILVNLIRNAVQATQGQACRRIDIHLYREQAMAVMRVQDSGPGFNDPALKATAPYSSKSEGMGVGLVISEHIAEQHRGQLLRSNMSEGGACVTLKLPAVEGAT